MSPIATRPIPVSGEALPVIGLGTVRVFEFNNNPARYTAAAQVVQAMVTSGASLIDTAHSYGSAEARTGDVVSDLGVRDKMFLATKFGSNDSPKEQTRQMQNSLRLLKTDRIDLLQAWNVSDRNYSLSQLRDWKVQGICRYTGITTCFRGDYDALAAVLKREKPDFFQVNYSIGDRDAEKRLLPIAKDVGVAVLANRPMGGGYNLLFPKVARKSLPDFAAEIDVKSWGQFFLKFIVSHPAVTVALPGTHDPAHMLDNLDGGRGRMPDAAMRKRMTEYWDGLA